MSFPVTFGWPQIILLLFFVLGVGLLISSAMSLRPGRLETVFDRHGNAHHRRRRRRFRWHHGTGGLVFLLLGIVALWLATLTQAYIGLTNEVRAARVHATPIINMPDHAPAMSVDITLYNDQQQQMSTNTYVVYGNEWMVQADFIEVQPWLGLVGMHSGYKLTRLEGRFDDSDLERHHEHTVVDLNGGDDNFFKTVKIDSWYSHFVKGIYGSATFVPANGQTYDILVSQDAIKAEPAKSP